MWLDTDYALLSQREATTSTILVFETYGIFLSLLKVKELASQVKQVIGFGSIDVPV
jgi:hypothetical protein